MENTVATQKRRSWQLAAVAATAALAVLASVRISAGIQGSGKALAVIGPVTGVGGGVSVGDSSYSTSGALFRIDGRSGNLTQLRDAQVVSLWGRTQGNQSLATEVVFNGNVVGLVSGIDTQSGSFVVLQQTIRVSTATVFGDGISPAGLAGLQNGQAVEVSGFTDSSGVLLASRIDPAAAGSLAQVVGAVQNLDSTRQRFKINSLSIDYSGAEVDGTLAGGTAVVARGARIAADGTLLAGQVEVLPAFTGPPGTDGRLDGVITSFSSSTFFAVNGQPVAVSSDTKLQLQQPLGLDVEVRVTGTFDANGVLVASKVKSHK